MITTPCAWHIVAVALFLFLFNLLSCLGKLAHTRQEDGEVFQEMESEAFFCARTTDTHIAYTLRNFNARLSFSFFCGFFFLRLRKEGKDDNFSKLGSCLHSRKHFFHIIPYLLLLVTLTAAAAYSSFLPCSLARSFLSIGGFSLFTRISSFG
jgi:hypothetical protein